MQRNEYTDKGRDVHRRGPLGNRPVGPNNWWCSGGLMQRNKPSTLVCRTSLIFQRLSAVVIKSCSIIHCHGETNENYGFLFNMFIVWFLFFPFYFPCSETAITASLVMHLIDLCKYSSITTVADFLVVWPVTTQRKYLIIYYRTYSRGEFNKIIDALHAVNASNVRNTLSFGLGVTTAWSQNIEKWY